MPATSTVTMGVAGLEAFGAVVVVGVARRLVVAAPAFRPPEASGRDGLPASRGRERRIGYGGEADRFVGASTGRDFERWYKIGAHRLLDGATGLPALGRSQIPSPGLDDIKRV